jgi:hypothetical protein
MTDKPLEPGELWDEEHMEMEILSGQPATGFSCGQRLQDRFLYERAWRDQKRGV